MRHSLALPVLVALACVNAHAAVTASVSVTNQTPWTVTSADGSSRIVPTGSTELLVAGDTLGYEFDYMLTVSDGGLPFDATEGPFWSHAGVLVFDGLAGHPIPLFLPMHRTEFAVANLFFGDPFNGSFCPPWVSFSATWDFLATVADNAPQALSKSAHGFVSFSLSPSWNGGAVPATLPAMYVNTVGLGVTGSQVAETLRAAPVPEPSTMALLAVGLVALVLRGRHRICTDSNSTSLP